MAKNTRITSFFNLRLILIAFKPVVLCILIPVSKSMFLRPCWVHYFSATALILGWYQGSSQYGSTIQRN